MNNKNQKITNLKEDLLAHEKAITQPASGVKITFDEPLGDSDEMVASRQAFWQNRVEIAEAFTGSHLIALDGADAVIVSFPYSSFVTL